MAGAEIKGNAQKLEELVRRIKAGKVTVSIGVHAEDAGRTDPESGLSNAVLARIHEYGTETIPARSFIRAPLRLNQQRYKKLGAELMKRYVSGEVKDLQLAIMPLGYAMLSDIQAALQRGISPVLKDATVASKRRHGYPRPDVALYATGSLFNSIKIKYEGAR